MLSCVRAFGCEQISYPNLCFENVRKSVRKSVGKNVSKSVDKKFFLRFVTHDVHLHFVPLTPRLVPLTPHFRTSEKHLSVELIVCYSLRSSNKTQ